MLSNNEIYFAIETNIQSIHGFTYRRVEPDEYDEAINSVLRDELDRIDARLAALSKLDNRILTEITKIEEYEFNNKGFEKSVEVDYLAVDSSSSQIINTHCTRTASTVQLGEYYYAPKKVKYENVWKDYFIGKETDTFFSEQLYQVQFKQVKNTHVTPVEYQRLKTQRLYTPLSTIEEGKLKVFSNKYEIIKLIISRSKSFEELKIDHCKNKTLNFSEETQRHFIDLAVKRLVIRLNEEPQKINNLMQE